MGGWLASAPIDALAITAVTDLLLAAEALFLAGMLAQWPKQRFSAAWFWACAMALLGLAALVGGIDHGFVERAGLPRWGVQRFNWLLLGAMTCCVVLTIAAQFFRGRAARVVAAAGGLQFVAFAAALWVAPGFLVVIVNYAPVMLCFLVLNLLRLGQGAGPRLMAAGTLTLFAASAVQALGIDRWSPLDHNGLYHLISMPGVLLLFLGGRTLRTQRMA